MLQLVLLQQERSQDRAIILRRHRHRTEALIKRDIGIKVIIIDHVVQVMLIPPILITVGE